MIPKILALLLTAASGAAPDWTATSTDPDALDAEMEQLYGAGDVRGAAEVARRSLALREASGGEGDPLLPRSLNNLAAMDWALGNYEASRGGYERAISLWERALGPESPRVAAVQNNLGVLLRELGDLDGAQAVLERSLATREVTLGPEDAKTAGSAANLANVLEDLGRYDEAGALARRVVAIYERVYGREHPDFANALDSLANIELARGYRGEAWALSEEALGIRERILGLDHPDVAQSLVHFGTMLADDGRHREGRAMVVRAVGIFERVFGPEHPTTGAALENLAGMLEYTGEWAAARATCDRALRILEASLGPDHARIGYVLETRGDALAAMGDNEAAAADFQRSVDVLKRALGPDHPDVAVALFQLAGVAESDALARGREALAIWERALGVDDPRVASGYGRLSGWAEAAGDLEAAREYAQRFYRIYLESLGPEHPRTLRARVHTARLRQGSAEDALADAEDALEAFTVRVGADHAARLGLLDEVASLANTAGQEARAQVLRSEALAMGSDQVYASLPWISDREARVLLMSQRGRLDAWLQGVSPQEGFRAWREVVQWKGVVGRSRTTGSDTAAGAALAALRREIARLILDGAQDAEIAALVRRREVLERSPVRDADVLEHVDTAAICAAIPRDAVLVDLIAVSGEPTYRAYVVDPSCTVQQISLGLAGPIDDAAQQWRDALAYRGVAGLPLPIRRIDARGQRLADLIWTPLLDAIGDARQVVIAPDRGLASIPWSALPLQDGRYLVEERLVTYVANAAELASAPTQSGEGMLLMGGVDFGRGEPASGVLGVLPNPCRADDWAALPGTAAEIARIAALPSREAHTVLSGSAPTEQEVIRQLPGHRVIHFATHGFYADDRCQEARADQLYASPMAFSGLVLADANRPADPSGHWDGVLTAEEVSSLDLRGTELVVLSGCETGLGRRLSGEGVLGLRRAFALAGARSTVMSLWAVSDAGTADLMTAFYEALRRRKTRRPAEALRVAQLEALETQRRETSEANPAEWAGFLVSGVP